jgi:cytochrome c oxidase cbb3-type subunit III
MRDWKLIAGFAVLIAGTASLLAGQEPAVDTSRGDRPNGRSDISAAALAGSKQDPAAVDRGAKAYTANCAGCHGAAAKGGPGAPDLIRSLVVLDDEKGNLIGPVIREGRPDKGMPKLGLSETQISDIVAWLHVQTYTAGHRTTYTFQNIATGDPKKGQEYFNGAGGCSGCHSVTADLAGIGRKYQPLALQAKWLQPRSDRRNAGTDKISEKAVRRVTVTTPDGQTISGTLDRIDDFTVTLHDSTGTFRSFSLDGPNPAKVEVHDPLEAHAELLHKLTDADIHNVTTYLVNLK